MIGAILNGVRSKSEYAYVYGDDRYYQHHDLPAQSRRPTAATASAGLGNGLAPPAEHTGGPRRATAAPVARVSRRTPGLDLDRVRESAQARRCAGMGDQHLVPRSGRRIVVLFVGAVRDCRQRAPARPDRRTDPDPAHRADRDSGSHGPSAIRRWPASSWPESSPSCSPRCFASTSPTSSTTAGPTRRSTTQPARSSRPSSASSSSSSATSPTAEGSSGPTSAASSPGSCTRSSAWAGSAGSSSSRGWASSV